MAAAGRKDQILLYDETEITGVFSHCWSKRLPSNANSPLSRKSLKHPFIFLLLLGLIGVVVGIDGFRAPDRQSVSRIFVATVEVYQRYGSPLLSRYVRCRYTPTCSRYSIAAVQRYGLGKGLRLTASRLWRCGGKVPLGTADPLP